MARHHVLGAEVEEGDDVNAPDFLNIACVTFRHIASGGGTGHQAQGCDGEGGAIDACRRECGFHD
ncbi:hypothetical protein SAMN05878426_1018 [Phaeovulum vinaykumarii]|uniref:Uncharacterized protein n=1 Tax=Phaeovulum vinaykumarii TaxID=407234 RepID=A0A1N7JII5_9RHOB|nr:hypothetical protein SAMN05421795_1018 [Phaeovulum vinaykumarii]SOB89408.1 hypothetical protein SAMN05878426_1018 [Phaeovulum vinaykumarii]